MRLEFEIQGIKRIIRFDGYCYHALKPGSEVALGYYSNIGGAILKHIKDASIIEEVGEEEVIQLKDYIVRLDKLHQEVRGMNKEDLFNAVVIEGEKRDMTAQREALKKFRSKSKETTIPAETKEAPAPEEDEEL